MSEDQDYGPAPKKEINVVVDVTALIAMLKKKSLTESGFNECPYCKTKVTFYKGELYYCQEHGFVTLTGGKEDGWDY